MSTTISGQQFLEFRAALLSAFVDKNDLKSLLYCELEKSCNCLWQNFRSCRSFQPPKSLSGRQLGLLHAAMMSVFEIEGLRRFLRFNLEKNLDELSAGGKKQDVIFDVLSASEREGWTPKLMRDSLEEFPGQDNYRQLIESIEGELT